MINNDAKTSRKHPFNVARVCLNAATVTLSVFLALAFLAEFYLLLLYITLTLVLTAISFWLKARPLLKAAKPSQKERQETAKDSGKQRKWLVIVWLLGLLLLPFALFLLSPFLPLHIWFVLIASLAGGIGISEIVFYLYYQKVVNRNV